MKLSTIAKQLNNMIIDSELEIDSNRAYVALKSSVNQLQIYIEQEIKKGGNYELNEKS